MLFRSRHAQHTYGADQGYGGGEGGHHSKHAATAIENHVRKHYGNKVADDMVSHSEHHVAHAEYVGGKEAKEVAHNAEKLRKKHGIKGDLYGHHEEPHAMKESVEQIDELKKSTLGSYVKSAARDASASRKLGADFQTKAEKSRNPSSKAASSRLADKFNAMAQKRHAGIGKAVERLTKEESVEEESIVKKNRTMDTLSGRVKVPADTHNQHMSTKVELKSEGWDDMMKAAKERAKPQPSGGSGVKQGSRYGGSKQKDKPEHDEKVKEEGHVIPKGNMLLEPEKTTLFKKNPVPANKPPYKVKAFESKRPDQDNVPFVTSESKPLTIAKDLAHKAMKRMKSEMLGKTGTSE
mgnify:CR=1 FL=1